MQNEIILAKFAKYNKLQCDYKNIKMLDFKYERMYLFQKYLK